MSEEIEAKAKRQGWVSPDDYTGDGEALSAEDFIKKGDEILAVKNERFKKQGEQLETALTEITSMKETFKEFGEYTKSQKELVAKQYQAQIDELKEKQRVIAADPDGNMADFDRIGNQIKTAEEAIVAPEPEAPQGDSPDFPAFQTANPWYNTDIEMTIYANQVGGIILSKHKSPSAAFYDEVAAEIKKKFPDKFKTEGSTQTVSAVEGATGTAQAQTGGGKRGYNDLPQDAKNACDGFVSRKLMTKKDYLKDYDWWV
jgi:hypothetical protein